MQAFVKVLLILAIIGAVNWGLVGLFEWNLVEAIFGGDAGTDAAAASRFVYVLVGIAGLVALFFLPRIREASRRRRV